MKVALVHELLTMKGGAENVLRIFAEMFPEAPIYTLLCNRSLFDDWFSQERIRTAALPPTSYLLPPRLRFNHHLYLNQFPHVVESWNFDEFDLVISSSSALAHGIITNGKPKHLSYIHSPARYLWDQTHAVRQRAPVCARRYLSTTFHRLREWDAEAAARADVLIAPSKEVQRRIELYWNRRSEVIHPPIDDVFFQATSHQPPAHRSAKEPVTGGRRPEASYFLIVSTLARYKQVNLAIDACNQLGLHLKIVGDGPDKRRLQKLAGPTIEFYGYRQGDELRDLYSDAQAVLFPGLEDFGLVPVEANACGTPVIAYRGGGVLETQKEGVTAAFFEEQTPGSLAEILRSFDHKKYSSENCRKNAETFRRSHFEQQMHTQISQLMAS